MKLFFLFFLQKKDQSKKQSFLDTDYLAHFKLALTPPPLKSLGLLHKFTRWPIMQKVRRHFTKKSFDCL